MPGIGLIKRRLETEGQAVALATSHILKEYGGPRRDAASASAAADAGITTLETKYDADSGDWYVALGWTGEGDNGGNNMRAVVRMDSILGTVTDVTEV